jgi:hypothetical protein
MDCPHKSPVNKDKNEDENIDKSIDRELYEKAFTAFNKANHSPPVCCDNNVAKFRVVLDSEKDNYGRPYFVCSKHTDRCEYFEWGDKVILQRPRCYHNETSKKRRVMKPGPNKGRLFFSCPRQYNDVAQCTFFQWEDETPPKTPPKREKKDDDDDIISQFTFPKIPSCQYRIPKRKKTPPLEEKNSDDDDIIPNSQPQKRKKTPPLEEKNKDDDTIPDSQSYTSEWMTPQRKKSEILSSDSEEEERNPFLFYTRNPRNRSFYC